MAASTRRCVAVMAVLLSAVVAAGGCARCLTPTFTHEFFDGSGPPSRALQSWGWGLDGKTILAADKAGEVWRVDPAKGIRSHLFTINRVLDWTTEFTVRDIAETPEGAVLAVVVESGKAYRPEYEGLRIVRHHQGRTADVKLPFPETNISVHLDARGRLLACHDHETLPGRVVVRVACCVREKLLATVVSHKHTTPCAVETMRLAVWNDDRIELWNLETGGREFAVAVPLIGKYGEVALAADPLGIRVAIADGSGCCAVIDTVHRRIQSMVQSDLAIAELGFLSSGRSVATHECRAPASCLDAVFGWGKRLEIRCRTANGLKIEGADDRMLRLPGEFQSLKFSPAGDQVVMHFREWSNWLGLPIVAPDNRDVFHGWKMW